jgi:rhodanese-related sulfurtransferase
MRLKPRPIPELRGPNIVPSRKSTAAVLLEAVIVMAVAASFAFAANELSPHGLKLGRDYFPSVASATNVPPKITPPADVRPAAHEENSETAEIDQRIKSKSLQPIDRAQVERLFHDPRYQQGLVIFIDARDEEHYSAGHIPGAYELDRYHPEKDLAADLVPCQNAEQVVVYCTGGDCEDAEFTALMLREAGVSNKNIFVYGGGFDDWSANHLPLEEGARGSGLAPVNDP